jgi:hypothetical protein
MTGARPATGPGLLLRMVPVLLVHPELWWVALRQAVRLSPTGWWRRPPFLPVPDRAYVRFRLVTQYGDDGHAPRPEDLLSYLRWCRTER